MAANQDLESIAKSMAQHVHGVNESQTEGSFAKEFTRVSLGLLRSIVKPLISHMEFSEIKEPIALFDNACGSGVVVQEVQTLLPAELLHKSSFTCADVSPAMVELVEKRIVSENWVNTEVKRLDATNTELPDNSFSHAALALALHIIPNPDAAVKDCMRVLKPGGRFGSSTWSKKNADIFWIPDMRSALASLPFDAPFPDPMPMQMHHNGHWDDAAWVEEHLKELGLSNVSVRETPGSYTFESAADFVSSFGMMIPWIMNAFWTEEMRNAHTADEVKALLQQHLEEKHGGKGWTMEFLAITMTGTVNK